MERLKSSQYISQKGCIGMADVGDIVNIINWCCYIKIRFVHQQIAFLDHIKLANIQNPLNQAIQAAVFFIREQVCWCAGVLVRW